MERRHFGRTGLFVSALGFGCGAVGGLMVRGEPGERREAVAAALDAGVTYFDTAPGYGDGASETNLGRALDELNAHGRVVVGTKVSLGEDGLRDPRRAARRSLEASLQRLRRDHVHVVYLHDRITEATGTPEVRGALEALKDGGLAQHAGFTAIGETGLVKEVAAGGYEAAQCYLNALDPSGLEEGAAGGGQDFAGLIAAAADRGVAVVAIRVYAAGALSARPERHPIASPPPRPLISGSDYAADVARARRLEALAGELGLESPLELSLRFCLSAPGVATSLVGLSSPDHLRAALRWTERGPLDMAVRNLVLDLASGRPSGQPRV